MCHSGFLAYSNIDKWILLIITQHKCEQRLPSFSPNKPGFIWMAEYAPICFLMISSQVHKVRTIQQNSTLKQTKNSNRNFSDRKYLCNHTWKMCWLYYIRLFLKHTWRYMGLIKMTYVYSMCNDKVNQTEIAHKTYSSEVFVRKSMYCLRGLRFVTRQVPEIFSISSIWGVTMETPSVIYM